MLECPKMVLIVFRSTPSANSHEAQACLRSCSRMCGSSALSSSVSNARLTLRGSIGVPHWVVNTSPVSCQSGPSFIRSSRCLVRYSRRADTAPNGIVITRLDCSVLVSPRTSCPFNRCRLCPTRSVRPSRSTSLHRSPNASPRLKPVLKHQRE